ncbi:MAG: FecR protein [Patescibacteria group bacterium]|nr:FecR protein [Patescibacteria group bacterium]
MKGERRLGSFDQLGDAYNKPVNENGDFDNQKGKNPKIEKKDTTPKKDPQPQKSPRSANKNEILPDDTKKDSNPDRTPIGFKQKSKTEPENTFAPKVEKAEKKPAQNQSTIGPKIQKADQESKPQHRIVGSRKKRGEPGLSSVHAGPKNSLDSYEATADLVDTGELINIKANNPDEGIVPYSARRNPEEPVRVIRKLDSEEVDDFFAPENPKSLKLKKGFAPKKPTATNNDFKYTPKAYEESPKSKEYFKKKDEKAKSFITSKSNKLISTIFENNVTAEELARLDKKREAAAQKREEKKMVQDAEKMVSDINKKSIEKPTESKSASKIIWPNRIKPTKTDSIENKALPSKTIETSLKTGVEKKASEKISAINDTKKDEKSSSKKPSIKPSNKLVWPLKSGTANSEFTVLDRSTQRYGVAGSQESVASAKKSPETKISPDTATVSKSLDETLNEMEKKARASIKETADKTADDALKGNQEEIDASTLRINQHNTLKENIANLQKKRDLLTQGNDQAFDNTLVRQIDDQISELENLSPYKSEEHENTELKAESLKLKEIPNTESPETETKTVNESFAQDEKNQNDTFNPGEKTVAEAYQEGILKPVESKDGAELSPESGIAKSPELLALEQARAVYAEKQKSFLDNKRKTQNSINKIRDFFGFGKKVKEEDLPQELKELKSSYDQMKVSFGKSLINQQIRKIEEKAMTGEITEEERSEALEMYMKGELFDEIVVKERESLLALQAETLPAKQKGILSKALDSYLKLKPWQRTVISSALITGAIATTGAFASAGVAGTYLGTKIAKGVASVYVGKQVGAGVDSLLKKEFNKDLNRIDRNARFDIADFDLENFDRALSYAEKSHEHKLKLEQSAKRVRLIMKGVVSLTAGLATNNFANSDQFESVKDSIYETAQKVEASKLVGMQMTEETIKNAGEKIFSQSDQPVGYDSLVQSPNPKIILDTPYTPVESTIPGESETPIIKEGDTPQIEETPKSNEVTPETPTTPPSEPKIEPSQPETPEEEIPSTPKTPTPETSTVSVEADKLGAIETFKDLKEKLAQSYPDSKLAPANAREILEGDPTELAIKYGFYNPSQSAESAMLLKGEQIGIDTKGNLFFKDVNGTIDTLSQGDGFDGKMIDSVPSKTPLNIEPNPYKDVVPVKPEIGDVGPEGNKYANVVPREPNILGPEKNPYADVVPVKPEINLRGNTYYSPDQEIDAMMPKSSGPASIPTNPEVTTTQEIAGGLDAKSVHTLAEKEFTKDINSIFQKPNFILGGSTPGTQTEEWARTLKFIEEKNALGKDLFEAMDAQQLQNTQDGEFFTLGEYARSLKNETGLVPNDGELLKDYFIRANEYKITHGINDKELLNLIDESDKEKKITIDESTRQKIRARRSVDNDGVYN